MTPDDDVRAMEIAAKLVLGVLVLLSVGFVAACLESVLKNGRRRAMTQGDEVRAMEIATKLVLGPLAAEPIEIINWTGRAMAAISEAQFRAGLVSGVLANEPLEAINAVGELLAAITERDREQIRKGERWGRGSRALTQDEGQKVLRGLTIDQVKKFAKRWGYGPNEVISWAMGSSKIHGGALWALGDQDEMAKITGETR